MMSLRIAHETEISKIKFQHESGVAESESMLENWEAKQSNFMNTLEEYTAF